MNRMRCVRSLLSWKTISKKALVQHPCRQELEQQIGSQMFSLWESEIPTFDPAIAEDLIEESGLESQYTLTASAEFEFNGETHNRFDREIS